MEVVNDESKNTIAAGKLIVTLKQHLEIIYFLQQEGKLVMSNKVSYALSRNYAYIMSLCRKFDKHNNDQKKLYVLTEGEGEKEKYVTTEDGKDWKFATKENEDAYNKALDDFSAKLVEWNPYKVYEKDLAQVQNLPVTSWNVLSEFGMLTEVEIVSSIKIQK